ncbi:MAG: hypothetical protein IT379_23845, partial [Deltaproteobacteria bacterium]|nr:hypothetical protein [Deltaproteobacteria bacterium]
MARAVSEPPSPHRGLRRALAGIAFTMAIAPTAAARADTPCATTTAPSSPDATHLLLGPRAPRAGERLRVLAARSGSLEGAQLVVHGPDGTVAPENVTVLPGPTALLAATLPPASAGRFTARVVAADGSELACRTLDVAHESSPRARRNLGRFAGVWPIEAEWDARHEVLFSAWIARLFYVEPDAFAGWNPLHRVFRDPARNVLFDHLGLGEDSRSPRVVMRADCADTLYGLRAYFAWKMRLPFLVHRCNRGTAIRGPRCRGVISNLLGVRAYGPDPVRRFSKFMHRVFETVVHSGTTRTMPDAERSDFYPIAI